MGVGEGGCFVEILSTLTRSVKVYSLFHLLLTAPMLVYFIMNSNFFKKYIWGCPRIDNA